MLNHPNGIASDGKHFYICDTWNNRVLCYHSLPNTGTKPDFVIPGTSKGGCQLADGRIVLFGGADIDFYAGKPTGSNWKPSMTISGGIKDPDDDDKYYYFDGGRF